MLFWTYTQPTMYNAYFTISLLVISMLELFLRECLVKFVVFIVLSDLMSYDIMLIQMSWCCLLYCDCYWSLIVFSLKLLFVILKGLNKQSNPKKPFFCPPKSVSHWVSSKSKHTKKHWNCEFFILHRTNIHIYNPFYAPVVESLLQLNCILSVKCPTARVECTCLSNRLCNAAEI